MFLRVKRLALRMFPALPQTQLGLVSSLISSSHAHSIHWPSEIDAPHYISAAPWSSNSYSTLVPHTHTALRLPTSNSRMCHSALVPPRLLSPSLDPPPLSQVPPALDMSRSRQSLLLCQCAGLTSPLSWNVACSRQ
ncbi:hypothetical protein B0F90DRAFT_1758104 [Multifurca ochricompacta]|uniref:Uncharacterized protein n=1 Tax=Multifurca ochricompacta TaxID=376703 RepID=A0AAD4QJ74_9AGAM|nr:hypothetical protein B0F90DRAFT_1758104 [Multifurca ochricompacta]